MMYYFNSIIIIKKKNKLLYNNVLRVMYVFPLEKYVRPHMNIRTKYLLYAEMKVLN